MLLNMSSVHLSHALREVQRLQSILVLASYLVGRDVTCSRQAVCSVSVSKQVCQESARNMIEKQESVTGGMGDATVCVHMDGVYLVYLKCRPYAVHIWCQWWWIAAARIAAGRGSLCSHKIRSACLHQKPSQTVTVMRACSCRPCICSHSPKVINQEAGNRGDLSKKRVPYPMA